jgi:hypothetical protein
MLLAPRELLARELLPLNPPEPPPKPPDREELPEEKSLLPMLYPPPLELRLPLLAELREALGLADRLLALGLAPRLDAPAERLVALAPVPRLAAAVWPRPCPCPPYLLAVALFE